MVVEVLKLFPVARSEDIGISELLRFRRRNIGTAELLDALLAVQEAANSCKGRVPSCLIVLDELAVD
jgi:hypothetical protein